MCGRYFLHSSIEHLVALFGRMPAPRLVPRYNIAPSQCVALVRENATGGRELAMARWGLVPGWSQGPDSRFSMINARSETVAEKPAYRAALRYRRCLIPADGFYEWRAEAGGKQPYVLRPRTPGPLALAGLWEEWLAPDGTAVESCSILVGPANLQIRALHARMPVVIAPVDYSRWLDRHQQHPASIAYLLTGNAMPELDIYPVSARVNNPQHDDDGLIAPLAGRELPDLA